MYRNLHSSHVSICKGSNHIQGWMNNLTGYLVICLEALPGSLKKEERKLIEVIVCPITGFSFHSFTPIPVLLWCHINNQQSLDVCSLKAMRGLYPVC